MYSLNECSSADVGEGDFELGHEVEGIELVGVVGEPVKQRQGLVLAAAVEEGDLITQAA